LEKIEQPSANLRAPAYRGLTARMSTPWVPNSAALEAEGASENVS
jgi:hypothetical protein